MKKDLTKIFDFFISIAALLAFALLLVENTAFLGPYRQIAGAVNLAIGLVFVSDVLMRFFSSTDRKLYFLHNWFYLIVFIPFFQLAWGIENTPFFVIVRQAVILAMFLSRVRKSAKLIHLLSLKPAQLAIATFAFAILAGTILLMLPSATRAGVRTPMTDALFTATSAVCVTGLAVRDTGVYFSVFGQTVILGLIQVGGLGIMTFSVSLALLLRKRMDMKHEAIMSDVLDQASLAHVKNLILYIFKMTLFIELLGALFLFIAWLGKTGGVLKTAYYAVFHAVSAFCNAGFSTFSDNLICFKDDITTNITVCMLIITGGAGFMVIKDIQETIGSWADPAQRKKGRFKLQTKVVVLTSFLLIALGAAAIYWFEKDGSFAGFSLKGKLLASVFQSVTSRTAGFNSCDIGKLSAASIFMIIVLMFIGGSPGSTAGGVKTTTFSVLWAAIVTELRGREKVEVFKRTIPDETVKKAAIMFFMSCVIVGVFAVMMMFIEKKVFADIMFETVSAFGTVGLSTGITPMLSNTGKILITMLMFIGRLGPLTIGFAFLKLHKPARYEYAAESVGIG
jgi:trk system potassium uptake protein